MQRLDVEEKNWKFSASDVKERKHWDEYQDAYEKMIRNTATEHAPWVVVPADNKWFSRLLVVATVVDALLELNLSFPKLTGAQLAALKEARKQLERE
jgi:polyphosphate kinase 2 (PPK2 family)